MMSLDLATLGDDRIANGGVTVVNLAWHSPAPTVLHMVTDPAEFRIVPESLELPAAANGGHTQPVIRITRTGTARHCDIHFVLDDGIDDDIDSIEVT